MNIVRTILIKSLIKPFYRLYAGLFFFIFMITIGAVGYANGAGLFEYHFALILGILKNPYFLLSVFFIWLLYIKKTSDFVLSSFQKPEFSFLGMLTLMETGKLYWSLILIQFVLLLPIVFYSVLIITEGIYLHYYLACFWILFCNLGTCMICAGWYLFILRNPGKSIRPLSRIAIFKTKKKPYWNLFITYLAREKKLLFLSIKIFSCCILYALVINLTLTDYELNMVFLFFSFGILGHGLLIHQMRDFEETRLTYYRTVPVSLLKRFSQYAILYFILLIPEIITISLLTPKYLHLKDAIIFVLFSYSLLLFLNSLLFIHFYRKVEYLKIISCIFLFIFLSVLTNSIPWLCLVFLLSSGTVFFKRYYLFEGNVPA